MTARSALAALWASSSERHSALDDAQGLAAGSMLASLGVVILSTAGLLTGGTAGIAFLLHYATELPFGAVFFAINLPFYYLALKRFGLVFTLKTFAVVTLTSLLAETLPGYLNLGSVDPLVAGLFGGLLVGTGMLALFRHQASLGGFGILALFIQDRFGWRAGLVQLAFDAVVLLFSFFVASPFIIACSVAGAVVLNITLAFNHRRDRYIAR